jgi:hypothetical protein
MLSPAEATGAENARRRNSAPGKLVQLFDRAGPFVCIKMLRLSISGCTSSTLYKKLKIARKQSRIFHPTLILLCTAYHRLVHEGGFRIAKDYRDRWFFKRPDGRAVPACGYCLADMLDDDVDKAYEGV